MSNILTVKVDVRKLDKSRFFEGKADANGHKPLYADLVLMPRREVGKFGDTHIVKQSLSKEEREKKIEMPIIGNATERGNPPQQSAPKAAPKAAPQDDSPDVPF